MGDSMGRARRLDWRRSVSRVVGLFRSLMEGRSEDVPNWTVDSIDKVLLMWPTSTEATFFHLSRLYRYGFRLKATAESDSKDLSLYEFFADGEIYRPDAGSLKRRSLSVNLGSKGETSGPLQLGQCRMGRAKPVLEALGFSELDTSESSAIQFAGVGGESWIFIDTRPDLFRREVSLTVAARLAEKTVRPVKPKRARDEGPSL